MAFNGKVLKMKKAWIENHTIRDIAQGEPASIYHPRIAAFYNIDVPDEAQNGDSYIDGVWTAKPAPEPVVSEPVAPVPPKVSPVEFKLLFTAQERVAIKTSNDATVQDFFELVNDPRLTHVNLALQSTQDALAYLTAIGILDAGRYEQIITGNVQ